MIVDCESCHTRFRLDEARIPASGAKVRCSKCKAAFVVKRPSATRDEAIDEVVAEATDPGSSRAPAPSEDLFETSASGSHEIGVKEPPANAEAPSDEKWEFDEPPPPAAAPEKRAAAAAPEARARQGGDAEDLDSLGSPEGWDFLGGARKLAADAHFETAAHESAPEASTSRAPTAPAPGPAADSVDRSLAAALAASPAPRRAPEGWAQATAHAAQTFIDAGMWLASIALCSAGLLLALAPRGEALATVHDSVRATLGEQAVEVTLHRLESGVGGTLTIVRGQLPTAPGSETYLRVRAIWLDAQGRPIPGASAIAGSPLPERELRELSLSRVRAAHEARSAALARGGAFEAAFGALPESARGIALRRERVPVPAPAATQEEVASAESARASSRPTALPSSE